MGDDPGEDVLLVGVGGAAVEAGGVDAVVAGGGDRLLERLRRRAPRQQADRPERLTVVQMRRPRLAGPIKWHTG